MRYLKVRATPIRKNAYNWIPYLEKVIGAVDIRRKCLIFAGKKGLCLTKKQANYLANRGGNGF